MEWKTWMRVSKFTVVIVVVLIWRQIPKPAPDKSVALYYSTAPLFAAVTLKSWPPRYGIAIPIKSEPAFQKASPVKPIYVE
jgi:hypothetical protein